jgi:hypothetical protein
MQKGFVKHRGLGEAKGIQFQRASIEGGMMLWAIFIILVVLWLLGFTLHVAGAFIHLLLVIALIVLIINLVTGRRAV